MLLHRRLRRPAVHRPTSATSSTTRRARSPATRRPRASTRGAACRCAARGDGDNDVLQYWFGAYLAVRRRRPRRRTATAFDAARRRRPVHGSRRGASTAPDSADNQDDTSSFIATSGILPPDEFKQFESWPSARYDKPGGPFDPHTGDQYVYSQIADVSYKRLTRTIAVPAGGGSMSFWTSYDTEADWDFLFVEARTPWAGRLDDPAGRQRPHDARRPVESCAGRLGRRCTRSSTTTRR